MNISWVITNFFGDVTKTGNEEWERENEKWEQNRSS